jgi:hypothetical protein
VLTVSSADPVPADCELYVIGGGEDLPQHLAAAKMKAGRPLHRAVDNGAVVLAVCAGLQILGQSFVGPDGKQSDGLGLLDCVTVRSTSPRAIGEVMVQPAAEWASSGLPTLTGFENHGAVTELGPAARPVGTSRSASATRTARSRGPLPATFGGPTSTGRCWRATRSSPTYCCPGWSGPSARSTTRSRMASTQSVANAAPTSGAATVARRRMRRRQAQMRVKDVRVAPALAWCIVRYLRSKRTPYAAPNGRSRRNRPSGRWCQR